MQRIQMKHLLGLLLFVGSPWACGQPPPPAAIDPSVGTAAQATLVTRCKPQHFVASAPEGFEQHAHTELSRRTPHHAAQDIILPPHALAEVTAWFDYGLSMRPMRPMRHERVHVFSARCPQDDADLSQSWHVESDAWTDGDGQLRTLVEPDIDGFGRVRLMFERAGDSSWAESDIWVVPKQTHFVVFDIDGNLSVNNRSFMREIAEHLIDETFWPDAYEGAQALTHLWLRKGYLPIYLTNKPHQLADITREWLQTKGFAQGPVLVSTLWHDLVPNISGAGAYKQAILTALQARGYQIDYAYGNEPTDIYAYSQADIAPAHIFSIGTYKGLGGTSAVEDSYIDHIATIEALLDRDGDAHDDTP